MFKSSLSVLLLLLSMTSISHSEDLDALMDLDMDSISMLDVNFESATKTAQKLSDIPSSIYVLSNERIMRSGYQSMAQVMSLVPGFYASKYDENGWMVSSRGFHDSLYNKILVMVDGRSVFSPMYGGVYWTDLDYLLADIERIEVLRGPGGAIWGANAANGVVNIITKSAQDTQGTHLSTTVGEYGYYSAELRQGHAFSDSVFAKVFYKHKQSPNTLDSNATDRDSDQLEFTIEQYLENQTLTIRVGGEQSRDRFEMADITYWDDGYGWYYSSVDEYQSNIDSYSYFVQLNHQYVQDNGNKLSSMFVFQEDSDEDPFAPGNYKTVDFDINYLHSVTESTDVLIGMGINYTQIHFDYGIEDYSWQSNPDTLRAANKKDIHDTNSNVYIQADTWWNNQFKTVVGVKGEYFSQNETFELSPQARALYQLNNEHSFWAGIARAVMLPSYLDTDTELTYHEEWNGNIEPSTFVANSDLDNESVVTTELGYRFTPYYEFELDVTAFYSHYRNLRGVHELGYGADLGYSVDDFYYYSYLLGTDDDYSAKTYGIEIASHYQAFENVALYTSYSYLHINSEWEGGEFSIGDYTEVLDVDAQHNASLQVLWAINKQWQWDFVVKYLDQKLNDNASDYEFDAVISLDTRLAWQYKEDMPLVEVMAQSIGEDNQQDSWIDYPNEQKLYARISYQF